jgi:glycosyltransferase involved in cell wall biosynthesis
LDITMTCGRTPIEFNGGIETHVKEIAKRLSLQGNNIRILSTSSSCAKPYKIEIGGTKFETFHSYAPYETYYFSMPLYHALKSEKCAILHIHGIQDFSTLAGLLSKKPESKLFVTVHSGLPATCLTSFFDRFYFDFLRRLLNKADKIIGVSLIDLEAIGLDMSNPKNKRKMAIIPNGVDFSTFTTNHELPRSVQTDSRFILSVGRLEEYKGHDSVIGSFSKLKMLSSDNRDLKLVIVGSGKHKEKFKKRVKQLHIEEEVQFLSGLSREELVGLYQKCELFILLSKYESQGISVVDAIAAGKPTLISSNSALKHFVQKNCCVDIPFPFRTEEIAEKMQNVLRHPLRFSTNASGLASWDEVVEQTKCLYEESLAK